jgi:gliding motility-associated-like protein
VGKTALSPLVKGLAAVLTSGLSLLIGVALWWGTPEEPPSTQVPARRQTRDAAPVSELLVPMLKKPSPEGAAGLRPPWRRKPGASVGTESGRSGAEASQARVPQAAEAEADDRPPEQASVSAHAVADKNAPQSPEMGFSQSHAPTTAAAPGARQKASEDAARHARSTESTLAAELVRLHLADTQLCSGELCRGRVEADTTTVFELTTSAGHHLYPRSGESFAFQLQEPGRYLLELRRGDTSLRRRWVEVSPSPEARFAAEVNASGVLHVTNRSRQARRYQWNFGDGSGQSSMQAAPTYTYRDTGRYRVRLVALASASCRDTAYREVAFYPSEELSWPTIITPEGDGKNDCLDLPVASSCRDFSLKVFDRDGRLIFESNDPEECWDARYQASGRKCPNGSYRYLVTYRTAPGNASRQVVRSLIIQR